MWINALWLEKKITDYVCSMLYMDFVFLDGSYESLISLHRIGTYSACIHKKLYKLCCSDFNTKIVTEISSINLSAVAKCVK
jgi:hypothetical protein